MRAGEQRKNLGAQASEHSFKFCEQSSKGKICDQLKIVMDHSSPLSLCRMQKIVKHSACDNNLGNSCYTCCFNKRQYTPTAFYYSKCALHLNSCGRQLLVKLNLTWISRSFRVGFLKLMRKRVSTIPHQIGLYFVTANYMNWHC